MIETPKTPAQRIRRELRWLAEDLQFERDQVAEMRDQQRAWTPDTEVYQQYESIILACENKIEVLKDGIAQIRKGLR